MEIRGVIHGRDGYILASKTLNQKYHLVSKYSDVRLGDIVQANLIFVFVNIPEEYIECQTKLFAKYQNGFTKLALVNYGDEEAVWNLIKESNIEKEVVD